MDLDHIRQPLLQTRLNSELQRGRQFGAIRRKNQLQNPAAKIGPVDPFASIGEEELLDHVADVILIAGLGGAPAVIEIEWKIDIHQVAFTLNWVITTVRSVSVGLQIAWLSLNSTGWPLAFTLDAALVLVHKAVRQGFSPKNGKMHPAMLYGGGWVTICIPLTLTR
jgi:hypothetical protein